MNVRDHESASDEAPDRILYQCSYGLDRLSTTPGRLGDHVCQDSAPVTFEEHLERAGIDARFQPDARHVPKYGRLDGVLAI